MTPSPSAATPACTDEYMPSSKRGLGTVRAPARAAAGATSLPRCPVTTTTSSMPTEVNAPTARSSSVLPPASSSGLSPCMREERPAARTMAARRSMAQASAPDRAWTISAAMLTASSAGVSAPMARPTGEWMRPMASSSKPPSRSAASIFARFERLAMRPT